MAIIFFGVFIMAAIVYVAARIILGWILPKHTMAAFDSAVMAFLKFIFQMSIVMLGVFIVWAFWSGNSGK